jgi:hypothetical protein
MRPRRAWVGWRDDFFFSGGGNGLGCNGWRKEAATICPHPPTDTRARREHTDFSESTEEIAPLTEEEKKAKLEELREKAAARKALKAVAEAEDHKRNEVRRAGWHWSRREK